MKKIGEIEQWGPIESKVLYMSFWYPSLARSGQTKWKAAWPRCVGELDHDRITFYWDRSEMQKRGEWAIEHVILPDVSRQGLWRTYDAFISETKAWVANAVGDPRDEKPFEDIRTHASKLYETLVTAWDLGIIPEVANYAVPKFLEQKVASLIAPEDMHEVLEALLASDKLSFHQESERAFLMAVAETDEKKTREFFDACSRDHFWVENSYFETKIISAGELAKRAEGMSPEDAEKRLAAIQAYPASVRARKADAIKKFLIPTDIGSMAETLAFSIWWQDHRKAVAWWLESVVDVFTRAAAREYSISFDDLLHYLAEEWRDLFAESRRVPEDILTKRKEYAVIDLDPDAGSWKVLYGEEAIKDVADFKEQDDDTEGDTLRGTPVSRGKVTGKVKVLLTPRHVEEMPEGAVLVAPMTSPDYIVAMRKSSAIVTDVGGLMSHAAIVSRELGKPCIVGTKVATKMLKDGDMVEVDAQCGIVKKIN